MSLSTYHATYRLLRESVRDALIDAVNSAYCGEGVGSVLCRAGAALELLLAAHGVDRRGRCRSCRRPGWLGRRRRICMVYEQAHFWLHQPPEVVLRHLAAELDITPPPPPDLSEVADPDATDVLPRICADPGTECSPTPAAAPLPSDFPRAWWSDPDHGGVGVRPDRPRPHRGPPDDHLPPGPDLSVRITEAEAEAGARCPA